MEIGKGHCYCLLYNNRLQYHILWEKWSFIGVDKWVKLVGIEYVLCIEFCTRKLVKIQLPCHDSNQYTLNCMANNWCDLEIIATLDID